MTDKQYDQQKKRIEKYVNKWLQLFHLHNWKGRCVWERDSKKNNDGETEVLAHCFSDWKYLIYELTFFLSSFVHKSEKDVERIVVHEMLHIVINEMRENRHENEERVVSTLTNIMEDVYEAGQKNSIKPKKAKKK